MKKICIIFSFLSCSFFAFAQNKAEIDLHRNILVQAPSKRVFTEAKNNQNEFEFIFSNLFLFYKTFISSQDLASCTFSPSCSEFGILAVKEYGMIKGVFLTFDRLTRCNGLSSENYEMDPHSHLLIDKP